MKNILVPTDFSPNAGKALDFAVQIARLSRAQIILVHACDLVDTTFKDHLTLKNEHNQAIIDKANENLSLLKRNMEGADQLFIRIELYKGSVTDAILQACEENHADLIIIGTLGKAGLKEKVFGSITAGIIGKTYVPVIAVPFLSEWDIPENILLAVNDFEEQPGIVKPVFELAGLFNATIHVVIFTDADTAEAADYLKHKRSIMAYEEKLRTHYKYTKIQSVHLDGQRFVETIEEYIVEQGIDIVAMVTHKRTLLGSVFSRSLTKKMTYNTKIPLLAIPA
jgi:nucleotide-binding universal stress UspA family protein